MTEAAAISDFESMKVLVVEDDDLIRLSVEDRLRLSGIPVVAASDIGGAIYHLSQGGIDLVITDIRLPDGSGRDLFAKITRHHPGLPVVLMTAFGTVADAVELIKAGALDYIEKPFDMEVFLVKLKRILGDILAARDTTELIGHDGTSVRPGSGFLGRNPAMHRIERLVARIKDVDSPIIITGESGVGKEVLAGVLHRNSRRRLGPYVRVNCAAISPPRFESELFGQAEGASWKPGRFEQAHGGTLFLDEVGAVPMDLQERLVRVLQDSAIDRNGDRAMIDVRVIVASQQNLTEAMNQGRFLPDLYWSLEVIHIRVPPLRERTEDVVFFARLFLQEFAGKFRKTINGLTESAEQWLVGQTWQGNLWELRNVLARAVALAAGTRIDRCDLLPVGDEDSPPSSPTEATLRTTVEEAEQGAIRAALARHHWAIGRAAEALGISRKGLWEKMRRYGIANREEDSNHP